LATVTVSLLAVVIAPSASASHTGLGAVRAFDYGFEGVPAEIEASHRFDFKFANVGAEFHEFVLLELAPEHQDATVEEAIAAADSNDLSFISGFAGAAFAAPGEVAKAALRPDDVGRYVYFCFFQTADDVPHYQLGMVGFLDAT